MIGDNQADPTEVLTFCAQPNQAGFLVHLLDSLSSGKRGDSVVGVVGNVRSWRQSITTWRNLLLLDWGGEITLCRFCPLDHLGTQRWSHRRACTHQDGSEGQSVGCGTGMHASIPARLDLPDKWQYENVY